MAQAKKSGSPSPRLSVADVLEGIREQYSPEAFTERVRLESTSGQ